MWGPDILVAPVVEQGATTRRVYLPQGTWFDFWTEERIEGGREIERPVDLKTMPLYIRGGTILPMGPVKQYVEEPTTEPSTLVVYPGLDREASIYEDDGKTFDHRRGMWMRLTTSWTDAARRLALRLAPGSRMLPPNRRNFNVRVAGTAYAASVAFAGRLVEAQF
jgi:alpha-glucosidase/alpha-D-xyloside xylohydrolase